jgi:hypothetical protein
MPTPERFTVEHRKNGDLVIRHLGRTASPLIATAAERLRGTLAPAADERVQHRPASVTGSYQRGNERR